jgi:hypothetical protein
MEAWFGGEAAPERLGPSFSGRSGRIPTITAWLRTGLLLILLIAVAACAGGMTEEGTYRDPQRRFTLRPPPAPWQLMDLDGARLAFRLPVLMAGMGLRGDCESPEPGPLPSVSRHLFFGLRDMQFLSRDPVVLASVGGFRTRLIARLEEMPVEVEAVTLRHQDCLYDFLYVAPPDHFAQGQKDFEAFLKSWMPVATP